MFGYFFLVGLRRRTPKNYTTELAQLVLSELSCKPLPYLPWACLTQICAAHSPTIQNFSAADSEPERPNAVAIYRTRWCLGVVRRCAVRRGGAGRFTQITGQRTGEELISKVPPNRSARPLRMSLFVPSRVGFHFCPPTFEHATTLAVLIYTGVVEGPA